MKEALNRNKGLIMVIIAILLLVGVVFCLNRWLSETADLRQVESDMKDMREQLDYSRSEPIEADDGTVYIEYNPYTPYFLGHDEFGEGSFNPNRNFFYLDGYGNPVSLDYIGYNNYSGKWLCDRIDIDDIIDEIIDNNHDYGLDEIREALDDYEME